MPDKKQGEPEDRLTEARLGLLSTYSSQATTHGTYVISSVVVLLTWLQFSGTLGWIRDGVASLIFTGIVYSLMRTVYWGTLSTSVINLGEFISNGEIDFSKLEKQDYLDDNAKGKIARAKASDDLLLRAHILSGPTFTQKKGISIGSFLLLTHKKRPFLYAVLISSFIVSFGILYF